MRTRDLYAVQSSVSLGMSSTMDKSKSRDYERVHNSKRSNKDADLPDYVQTLVVKGISI